ncbi:L,D-transpeptidase [Actinocrispum wychmicini]|uniref:Lipoprotein-anchoring transpeptidase ErfK/SrfK n=1 Tax=Actinocrispum wychmicini TaxID=1213861 RepID=A0A4R2K0E3_9PSEU|nr:Ig-like domain-containing protein [Actinocrispum wychmicini]TCO65117.1 lipoprotein-anchoring transpeptidase ErfK/SrfK [Actinocrispum wychmicini]
MTTRLRSRLAAGIAATALLGLAACSSESKTPLANVPGPQATVGVEHAAATQAPATVALQPGNGAADASPKGPITVSVTDGTIGSVQLTNPDGKPVKGDLSADKHTWTAAEALGYGKSYTWSGTATGANGQQVPITGAFATVKPKRQISGTLNVGDDQTYGVAMPIALKFDNKVIDKASVEKALKVETSVPTEGSWAWLDDKTVHWRPKAYWKADTKVTVTASLYGTSFGGDAYGKTDVSSKFTIGREQTVEGNTQTHRLVIKRNGQVVNDFPASYGLDSDPGRVTQSGIHVAMEKYEIKKMTNEKYDYRDVPVPWAVRISNNGEFIHGLAASIPSQGKRNVSHGCTNLSPANAKIYYDSVLPGDPVEITGTNQQLSSKDGDYYDWTLTWDQWTAKSALK